MDLSDLIGAFHRGILRGVSAQHLLLARIGTGFGHGLKPDRLDLFQLDLHLRHRDLLGRIHPPLHRRRARHFAAQIANREIVSSLREADIGRRQRQEHVRPAHRSLKIDPARHQRRILRHEYLLEQQRARDRAAHAERIPVADDRYAFRLGG